MAGVEVNRLNLVTKIAVITAYSTNRVDHSLPQSAQVCTELCFYFFVETVFVVDVVVLYLWVLLSVWYYLGHLDPPKVACSFVIKTRY